MTAQTLNALKGWPQMAAVDFNAALDSTVLGNGASGQGPTRVQAGSVVHINSSGNFKLGVGTKNVMPMFLFNASDDPDVMNDGGNAATTKGVFIAISPTGQMMALVAIGAYELVTTAYDTSVSYAPNAPLTSGDQSSGGQINQTGGLSTYQPNAGLITAVAYTAIGTDMIVGICSRGVVDNGYGTDAVAFWPHPIFPGSAGSASD